MDIVIKISDGDYEYFKTHNKHGLYDFVVNGIQLPKGHGDLIDRRELKKEVYTTTEWNGDIHRIIYEASIDDANPIIPADKE